MKNTKPNILLDAIHFRQPNDCTLTKKKNYVIMHYGKACQSFNSSNESFLCIKRSIKTV